MTNKINYQKLRGGYYTPESISQFLVRWAIRSPQDEVLEPSCGDGSILTAALQELHQRGAEAPHLLGIELDPHEAEKAAQRLRDTGIDLSCLTLHTGDFFEHCRDQLFEPSIFEQLVSPRKQFDAVIGNPPFIRYQNFPEEYRELAFQFMRLAGLQPNRLTNIWVPFLITSSLLLKDHGRLAMVIPAELFQVKYAAESRQFLSDYFTSLTIITFKSLLFEGTQQEVVLLLGEHNGHQETGIRTLELDTAEDLAEYHDYAFNDIPLKPMDHSTEKWTQYFLTEEEIQLLRRLREHPGITNSGDVLDVDVGIVTGQNKFFILSQEEVNTWGVEPYLERMVTRSGHLKGAVFSAKDWIKNVEEQLPAFLFSPLDREFEELSQPIQAYIKYGEEVEYHTGYKCRIRQRWYIVPSVWIPDAFMLRQVHGYPKLILNDANVTCTDTIHRVRFLNGADQREVTAAFLNSLTFAFAEVTGRSYGGGVLTFEPSEAESLPLPLSKADVLDLDHLDDLIRKGRIEEVLDITDRVLLEDGLGLPQHDVKQLRSIWHKLRDRRINRK